MAERPKFKNLIILLPIFIIIYMIYTINDFHTPTLGAIVYRDDCICESNDKEILEAFSDGQSTNFTCPMTMNNIGRLGNVMGEYATLVALSQLNGQAPYQLESMKNELIKYFNPSLPIVKQNIYDKVHWMRYNIHDWMSDEYSNFSCNFNDIHGYPCSWTFFHHIRSKIKKEFQFTSQIVQKAQNHLLSLRKLLTTTYVGIHVRRSDYLSLMKDDYDGVLATSEFFTKAMAYYRDKYKDCLFVVCSDDLNWCEKNINNSLGDVHFCWNGKTSTPGEDMALLTHCNHSIITIGTFGFWSAYLTGGEVVYLNNYLKSKSKFHKVFHFDAAYLPEWIPINADLNSTQWLS